MTNKSYQPSKTRRKKPGWRESQLIKKNRGVKKNILGWFILIIVIIFVISFVKFFGLINDRVWDGESKINILIYNKDFSLVSYSPKEKSLVLIEIPTNLYVDVPGGYGKFQLFAVPRLADFEKKKDLVVQTIQNNLMVPIDGYIVEDDSKSPSRPGDEFKQSIFFSCLKSNQTNLKPWDLLRLWWNTKKLGESRLEKVVLSNRDVLNEKTLPDKAKVYEVVPEKYDLFIQKYSVDTEIRKERLSIEVLNGTEYSNLAQQFSRLLTNIGGVIIGVGNTNNFGGLCQVSGSKVSLASYTAKKITKTFGCQIDINEKISRSDLEVTVGKQFWEKLYMD